MRQCEVGSDANAVLECGRGLLDAAEMLQRHRTRVGEPMVALDAFLGDVEEAQRSFLVAAQPELLRDHRRLAQDAYIVPVRLVDQVQHVFAFVERQQVRGDMGQAFPALGLRHGVGSLQRMQARGAVAAGALFQLGKRDLHHDLARAAGKDPGIGRTGLCQEALRKLLLASAPECLKVFGSHAGDRRVASKATADVSKKKVLLPSEGEAHGRPG